MSKLMDSWFTLLDGEISVPVYIESVPEDETGNYVLLRAEGETDVEQNDKSWIKSAVIVCDIVTVFKTMINSSTADGIYNEIGVLLADSPFKGHNLTAQSGMIINSVEDETSTYRTEEDERTGTKYYRKITRFNHLVTIKI